MPDPKGKLSDEEKQFIADWLDKNWTKSRECPVSGHNSWTIADHLVVPMNYRWHEAGGGTLLSGEVYPQAMVICTGCGYSVYFNAVKMELFKQAEEGAQNAKS